MLKGSALRANSRFYSETWSGINHIFAGSFGKLFPLFYFTSLDHILNVILNKNEEEKNKSQSFNQ